MDEASVYGSGLNSADWIALREAIWPFLHATNPAHLAIFRRLPKHLQDHPVVRFLREYRETGDERYLDQAGRGLIPTTSPFGWYVPLTK
jgi:hypothetical protein